MSARDEPLNFLGDELLDGDADVLLVVVVVLLLFLNSRPGLRFRHRLGLRRGFIDGLGFLRNLRLGLRLHLFPTPAAPRGFLARRLRVLRDSLGLSHLLLGGPAPLLGYSLDLILLLRGFLHRGLRFLLRGLLDGNLDSGVGTHHDDVPVTERRGFAVLLEFDIIHGGPVGRTQVDDPPLLPVPGDGRVFLAHRRVTLDVDLAGPGPANLQHISLRGEFRARGRSLDDLNDEDIPITRGIGGLLGRAPRGSSPLRRHNRAFFSRNVCGL
mmetsp:Transcript_4781/g.21344  ORF Transcript_4781/g.21344 Transcript_4781/m.21344 type:complete len:269 (-) Transcript_4781:145-951(-)